MEGVIVRHGETEWSLNGRHTGRTDLELTKEGRRRAVAVGKQLAGREFVLVLSSPLLRARETCALAGFSGAAEIDDDLHEWDYGDYEGLTSVQIHEQRPDWRLWRDGCPGGESPAQVAARADRVIERVRATDGDSLLFAHGHILRVLGARWIGLGPDGGSMFALDAGAVSVLGFEHEAEVFQRWNG